jgi:hypothetical protein
VVAQELEYVISRARVDENKVRWVPPARTCRCLDLKHFDDRDFVRDCLYFFVAKTNRTHKLYSRDRSFKALKLKQIQSKELKKFHQEEKVFRRWFTGRNKTDYH